MKDHLKITSLALALASLFCFPQPGSAQIPNQVFVGTRPLSMGGAFVAVADDGNAIYWNPAGLARMDRIQVNFAYADLFGLGIHHFYASFLSRVYFIPPLTDYLSFGVDWSGIHSLDRYPTGEEELGVRQDQFNFSLALTPLKGLPLLRYLALGANGKYIKGTGEYDGNPEADFSGWGWDFGAHYNLGALRYVTNGIQVGLMVHDVGNTQVRHKTTRTKERLYHENIRWGMSYKPFENWPGDKVPIFDPVLALDFDDRVHFGFEFWLAKTLAFRMGWQKDWHTNEKASLSFGVGFKKVTKDNREVRVDYALTDTPVLPNTNKQFGGSLIFKNNPRWIRIERVDPHEVFASLYLYYEKPEANLCVVKLKNFYDEPLTAYVSLLAGKYTQAHPDTIVIAANSTVEHKLQAFFNADLLDFNKNRLPGEVNVTYEYNKTLFTPKAEVLFPFYAKNFITWDDPAKAAVFVTPQDTSVVEFCKQLLGVQSSNNLLINSKISLALTVFEALAEYGGLKYKPDPNLAKVLDGKTPDLVQYPSEFLKSRQGDCDDFAVLYAALLENFGISTALLSTSDHVFIMFDTGLLANQRYRFKVDPGLLIEEKGKIWLPIETTWIDSSFARAWQEGADRYQLTKDNGELGVFPVREGWARYAFPSTSLPFVQELTSLKFPGLDAKIQKSLISIQKLRDEFVEKNYYEVLKREPNSLRTRNELGVLYAQNGEIDKADKEFREVSRRDSSYAPALNNLGNIFFIKANYDDAASHYQKALRKAPKAAGTHLNLAILYHFCKYKDVKDSTQLGEKSLEELRKAKAILQESTDIKNDSLRATYRALDLLGLPVEPDSVTQGNAKQGLVDDWKKLWNPFTKSFYSVFKPRKKVRLPQPGAPRAGQPDPDRVTILWWSE